MSAGLGNINRLVPGLIERSGGGSKATESAGASGKAEFGELLGNMVNSVDELQKDSAQIQDAFMAGEPVELHQVMIKTQEAGVAMDLLLEIRNKIIDGYKDIMRMPL